MNLTINTNIPTIAMKSGTSAKVVKKASIYTEKLINAKRVRINTASITIIQMLASVGEVITAAFNACQDRIGWTAASAALAALLGFYAGNSIDKAIQAEKLVKQSKKDVKDFAESDEFKSAINEYVNNTSYHIPSEDILEKYAKGKLSKTDFDNIINVLNLTDNMKEE